MATDMAPTRKVGDNDTHDRPEATPVGHRTGRR